MALGLTFSGMPGPGKYTGSSDLTSPSAGKSNGTDRLAAILVELADDNADVKRHLRLELAAQMGGDTIAAEIGKRITALRSAGSFLDWQKQREFVKDLDLQRAMIVDRVAETRADLALDLMWRFDASSPGASRSPRVAPSLRGIPDRIGRGHLGLIKIGDFGV
jgi:hypothetical protein